MLLVHEALTALGETSPYLKGALHILTSVCARKMSPPARFRTSTITVPSAEHGTSSESGPLEVDMGEGPETILLGSTINNYEFALRRWADYGLVYADYYLQIVQRSEGILSASTFRGRISVTYGKTCVF